MIPPSLPPLFPFSRRRCRVGLHDLEPASAGEQASCLFSEGPVEKIARGSLHVWKGVTDMVSSDGWRATLPT